MVLECGGVNNHINIYFIYKMCCRYLIFAGDEYYPLGGWNDFKFESDNLVEAYKFYDELIEDGYWAHIFDIVDKKIVARKCHFYGNLDSRK